MKSNGFSVSNGTGIEQFLSASPSAGGAVKALVENQLLLEWVTLMVISASARMRCEMSCKNDSFQKHYKDACKVIRMHLIVRDSPFKDAGFYGGI